MSETAIPVSPVNGSLAMPPSMPLTIDPSAPAIVELRPMGDTQRGIVGASLVGATVLLMAQLVAIWPAVAAATSLADPQPAIPATPLLLGLGHADLTGEVVLITMVLMVGALGALVGAARRFLYFATREELTERDEWSYLMRPVQRAMLALIVYFTLRGGYLGQDQAAPVNPYGVAALSALVGLFTRHAVSKLTDVFDTLFGTPKEDEHPVAVEKAS